MAGTRSGSAVGGPAVPPEQVPQAEHGVAGSGSPAPSDAASDRDRALEVGPGQGEESEVGIGLADRQADGGLDEGAGREPFADLLGGAVQGRPDLQVGVGLGVEPGLAVRAGLGQQVLLQELVDGLGDRGLGLGPVALLCGSRPRPGWPGPPA